MSSPGPQTYVPVPTKALWNWNTSVSGVAPTVNTYSSGAKTKTGLQPNDVRQYVQIPLQQFGNPPVPIPDQTVLGWIRMAEDNIENDTNIKLCQTWIAAPPTKTLAETLQLGLVTKYNYQQLGVDYDFSEAAYDFFFSRARDEGWLYQRLRWRPVKGVDTVDPAGVVNAANLNGTKNVAFIYPLLNEYFRMPQSWVVEDQDRGLVRFVPATSVQMLPLFAMQLAFMGFAENVPGGMWFQYTAGLTPADYQANWNFMLQLVLARTAVIALSSMQLSVNYGALETAIQADGLMQRMKFDPRGAFAGAIMQFEKQAKELTTRAKSAVGGVHLGIL
jgi:hypothetical protein